MLANAKLAPPFRIQDTVWLNPTQQGGGLYPSGANVLYFDGVNDEVNFGSSLDNIPSGASITVDGWFRVDAIGGATRFLLGKGSAWNTGWKIAIGTSDSVYVLVDCATTNAVSEALAASFGLGTLADEKWHHFCFVYDDTDDRKAYISVDGVWASSYDTQIAGVDAYGGDAASDLYSGELLGTTWDFQGAHGWLRISNTRRYTPGVDFDVPRDLPAVDGNTIEQWAVNEGEGSTVTASVSSPANDGTITGAQWIKG